LKGRSVGGAQVSPVHANWLVNTGGATAAQMLELIELVREEVMQKFGVRLELEVKVVGE
jgi:UDP-N-acetylmuramate dehydrogenase